MAAVAVDVGCGVFSARVGVGETAVSGVAVLLDWGVMVGRTAVAVGVDVTVGSYVGGSGVRVGGKGIISSGSFSAALSGVASKPFASRSISSKMS